MTENLSEVELWKMDANMSVNNPVRGQNQYQHLLLTLFSELGMKKIRKLPLVTVINFFGHSVS